VGTALFLFSLVSSKTPGKQVECHVDQRDDARACPDAHCAANVGHQLPEGQRVHVLRHQPRVDRGKEEEKLVGLSVAQGFWCFPRQSHQEKAHLWTLKIKLSVSKQNHVTGKICKRVVNDFRAVRFTRDVTATRQSRT